MPSQTLDIASIAYPAWGMKAAEWSHYSVLRRRTWAEVHQAVSSVDQRLAIGGSWAANDFHLTRSGDSSLSDVDAVILQRDVASTRLHVERHITLGAGRNVLNLRVSVHGASYEDKLSLPDAHCMGVILMAQSSVAAESKLRRYLQCKSALSLLRSRPAERYGEVAARIGSETAVRMYGVKLGVVDTVEADQIRRELALAGSDLPLHDLAVKFLVGGFDRSALLQLLSYVDSHFHTVEWLRDYLAAKVLATLIRPGGSWYQTA